MHTPPALITRVTRYCLTVVAAAAALAGPLTAQSEMPGMGMSGGWRMVPMDPNMIMLPGLAGAVPVSYTHLTLPTTPYV